MKDLSKNILAKIKKQDIHPISKRRFLLRNYGIWLIFGLLIFFGSTAVSVILFMLTDRDWTIYHQLNKSFFEYLILGIPYFWFILVLAFLAFAWYDFQKTKSGYKYSFIKIVGINILASVVLGVAFFYAGLGPKIDQIFADNLPYYQDIHSFAGPRVWQNPDHGLIAGEITGVIDANTFVIKDLKGQLWEAICKGCLWISGVDIRVGLPVRLIGKAEEGGIFQVSEARPFEKFIRGRMMQGEGTPRFDIHILPAPGAQ